MNCEWAYHLSLSQALAPASWLENRQAWFLSKMVLTFRVSAVRACSINEAKSIFLAPTATDVSFFWFFFLFLSPSVFPRHNLLSPFSLSFVSLFFAPRPRSLLPFFFIFFSRFLFFVLFVLLSWPLILPGLHLKTNINQDVQEIKDQFKVTQRSFL